jgi:hypothetical protein
VHTRDGPGAVFPEILVSGHAGNRRSLAEVVAGDPAVLQFTRGEMPSG